MIVIGHVATPTTKIFSMAITRPGTASPYRHCYDHATLHRSVSYDHGTTAVDFIMIRLRPSDDQSYDHRAATQIFIPIEYPTINQIIHYFIFNICS